MGERPAIEHLRDYQLGGLTTGSGLHRAAALPGAVRRGRAPATGRRAATLRAAFMPLEDLRDAWGPARVLHHATELCGRRADRSDPAVRLCARRQTSCEQLDTCRARAAGAGRMSRPRKTPDRSAQSPLVRQGRLPLLRSPLARQAGRLQRARTSPASRSSRSSTPGATRTPATRTSGCAPRT